MEQVFTVTWGVKMHALSAADAARKALYMKPQGAVICNVYEGERKVEILVQPPKVVVQAPPLGR